MKISIGLIAALLTVPSVAVAQNRGQRPRLGGKRHCLDGSVYGFDGQGARMAALVGPEGHSPG
jgi:hypothetical protein